MSSKKETCPLSCIDCAVTACRYGRTDYPAFCLTKALTEEDKNSVLPIYNGDKTNAKYAFWSATVEGTYYAQMARVEETMEFARRVDARKIGLAYCSEMKTEAELYSRMLDINGFEVYSVDCHAGAPEGEKTVEDAPEGSRNCDPISQALLLNEAGTDMNILMGLCAGSDALFVRYSAAMTTIMINKDRLTCNNPAVTLYRPERRKLI